MDVPHDIIRGVRGHKQKTRKNSVKSGQNVKNRLKMKEKAEILTPENFQKRGNQLKRGTLTPLIMTFVVQIMKLKQIDEGDSRTCVIFISAWGSIWGSSGFFH